MSNRETGRVWMGEILGQLYDSWPAKVSIHPPTKDSDDPDLKLWVDLVKWLAEEGLIRIGAQSLSGSFYHSTLGIKGFELLEKPIPGSEKTIGSKLGEMAKEAGKEAGKETWKKAIAELVGMILGAAIKS